MTPQQVKRQFEKPLVSFNGVMTFAFTFETDLMGRVSAFDSELGVSIISEWELSEDEANNILITFKDFDKRIGKWVGRGITCKLIEMSFNLREIESAYDLIGE